MAEQFPVGSPSVYQQFVHSVIEAQNALRKTDARQRRWLATEMCAPKLLNQRDALPVRQALTGEFPDGAGAFHTVQDRIEFSPVMEPSSIHWMLAQMQRWGQLSREVDYEAVVDRTIDPQVGQWAVTMDTPTFPTWICPGLGRLDVSSPATYVLNQPFSRPSISPVQHDAVQEENDPPDADQY